MSSSSFPYNWDNIIHVIKKMYSIINLKESKCDIYNMEYISQSPINLSKINLKCVLNCNTFPGKQANGYMFKTNCSSIEHRYKKLGDGFYKKRGNNRYTYPTFDNEFLASSKQWKLFPREFIFPIKQEDICHYNPRFSMSSGLMLDDIIMNLFSDITKQTTYLVKKYLFSKIQDDIIYLYKGYLQNYLRKNEFLIQKRHYVHIISLKKRN